MEKVTIHYEERNKRMGDKMATETDVQVDRNWCVCVCVC